MPTNDERRKVAARIRALREHAWDESSVFDLLGCAVEEYGLDDTDQLFVRLADLIEPEERTCYIEHVDADSFHLSCGHEADGYISPNYCPACGARVVDDHA